MSVGTQRAGMSQSPRDLGELSEELSETLRELRTEIRRPPRGPMGLPRPPTPRELLRFTEAHAIPATVAVLEANIRALELLAAAIRLVEGRADDADRVRSRAESISRSTLDRLDDALADLQDAIEGGPTNPEARRLLAEARDLRAEVDDRLREATATDRTRPGAADRDDEPEGREVPVDVEAELESLRAEVDDRRGDDA